MAPSAFCSTRARHCCHPAAVRARLWAPEFLADDEVCIATTNRNFQGRMGANSASVYLGSPYTVAATAVAGHIVDPREMLP